MRLAPLLTTWVALLLLLAVSVGGTFLPIGGARQVLSLGIAFVKGVLILWIFMDLRRSEPLVKAAAFGTVTFLAVMLILFSSDYLTRDLRPSQVTTPDRAAGP